MIRLLYRAILYNFNFMSAEKWLALPLGTKVRMICDYGDFRSWDIITRVHCWSDNNRSVRFETEDSYWYLKDHQWELIEGPKEEPRLPKQGDMVQVRDDPKKEWSDPVYVFVCFYKWKALVQWVDLWFWLFEYWRFPPKEEVKLRDGNTYFVEDRDGEKILKLKD